MLRLWTCFRLRVQGFLTLVRMLSDVRVPGSRMRGTAFHGFGYEP